MYWEFSSSVEKLSLEARIENPHTIGQIFLEGREFFFAKRFASQFIPCPSIRSEFERAFSKSEFKRRLDEDHENNKS